VTRKLDCVKLEILGDIMSLTESMMVITTSDDFGTLHLEKYFTKQFGLMGFGAIMQFGEDDHIGAVLPTALLIEYGWGTSDHARYPVRCEATELNGGCLLLVRNNVLT